MVELTSLTSRVELNEQNGPSRRQGQILRPRARISFRSEEQILGYSSGRRDIVKLEISTMASSTIRRTRP